jgi:hypothetical protein
MVLFLELCTELGGYQNLFSVGDDDDDESMHEETIRGEKVCFDDMKTFGKCETTSKYRNLGQKKKSTSKRLEHR